MDDNETLPLHRAVKQNDIDRIKFLLSKGLNSIDIDVNAEDTNGITALIQACIQGNEEIVTLLLNSGCPAQPPPGFRHTPLRGSAICGHAHLIPILLKGGADPNALSEGNRTALMGACFLREGVPQGNSVKCVKALLEDSRTDPTVNNSFGETALQLAKNRGYKETIEILEKAEREWICRRVF
jgi:FOG: Ankyrin repeat